MPATPLPQHFYARATETVAEELLGKTLVFVTPARTMRGRIVETEAYLGPHDLACHAFKGRTKRTEVMFGAPGTAYVYLIYGMYHMLNIVTEREDFPAAVLIRALEPVSDLSAATDGPGKLTRTLGITRSHNGLSLLAPPLYLTGGPAPSRVIRTPRIGIDYAGSWKDAPLRFIDPASPQLSRKPPRKTVD